MVEKVTEIQVTNKGIKGILPLEAMVDALDSFEPQLVSPEQFLLKKQGGSQSELRVYKFDGSESDEELVAFGFASIVQGWRALPLNISGNGGYYIFLEKELESQTQPEQTQPAKKDSLFESIVAPTPTPTPTVTPTPQPAATVEPKKELPKHGLGRLIGALKTPSSEPKK